MTGLFLADEACAGGDPASGSDRASECSLNSHSSRNCGGSDSDIHRNERELRFQKKNPRQRHSNHRIGVSGHAWLSLSFHVLSLNAHHLDSRTEAEEGELLPISWRW